MNIDQFIVTGGYVGYIGRAPGTLGSLSAAIVWMIITTFSPEIPYFLKGVVILGTFFLGLYSSNRFLATLNPREKDPSYIVIDEWAGMFCTYLFVPATFENLVVGFVFFRIFDIFKPFPVSWAEKFHEGWGVMLDDLVAGGYAALCLMVWDRYI